MRAFGEGFMSYRPPVDLKTITDAVHTDKDSPHVVLNFITPHQKWGIHSTYSDNLLMLTLNRGGPVIWISENDAATGRDHRQRLGRALQHQRGTDRPGGREPAHEGRHDLHVTTPRRRS